MLSLVRKAPEPEARVEIRHTGKGRFAVFVDDKRVTPTPLTRAQAEAEATARGYSGEAQEQPHDAMIAAARAIGKSAELQLAEKGVRELLNRQTTIRKTTRALHGEIVPVGPNSARRRAEIEREIVGLAAEETALKPKLREAFRRASSAREPYAAAMRAALRPHQLAAFDVIEVLVGKLADQVATLNIGVDLLREAGGVPELHYQVDLSALLQRIERQRRS